MLRRVMVSGVLILFGCAAVAGTAGYFDDAGKTAWNSEEGNLQVRLGVTLYPAGLVRAFDAPERPVMPILLETERVVPDQKFGVYVVFSGCETGADGNCNTTVVYEIVLPDGTVAVRQDELPVWQQPASSMPELSKGVWVTSAEPTDPPGKHLVRATVTDHVARKTVVLERHLYLESDSAPVSRAQTD